MTQEHGAAEAGTDPLRSAAETGLRWLMDDALPVWSEHGVNPAGGFFDRLDEQLRPGDAPMRLRVQARQTYVFAEAGRLAWTGDWRRLVEHGLLFLLDRQRPDGQLPHRFSGDGQPTDDAPDLYDQAFALFAFAHAFEALGETAAFEGGQRLLEGLWPHAHPLGGFRELRPGPSPLQANPQMHLLEAFLAWREADPAGPWAELAEDQAHLCRERLVHPGTLALCEFFDDDWRPHPELGGRTEPGHHYEWAWLLLRQGVADPLPRRLARRAERHGVDAARHVAVDVIGAEGGVLEPTARLWPQTERLRAAVALAAAGQGGPWPAMALDAFEGLFAYIRPAPRGLWYDLMDAEGTVRPEPAPASSLYHVMGALTVLARATGASG